MSKLGPVLAFQLFRVFRILAFTNIAYSEYVGTIKIYLFLDKGKFHKLLMEGAVERRLNYTLITLYWQWVHNKFVSYSITEGLYVTVDQVKNKWRK